MAPYTRSLFAVLLACASLVGCAEMQPADDEALVAVETPDTTPVDPGDDAPRPVDEPIDEPVVEPTDPVGACQPTPIGYPQANIPTLPDGLLDQVCAPFDDSVLDPDTPITRAYHFDSQRNVLVVEGFDSGTWREMHQEFTFDDAGRVRQIYAAGAGGFYTTEYGETTYRFDETGRLIHKLAVTRNDPTGEPVRSIEKTQRFDGDRLVERTEHDTLTDTRVRHWRWQWDSAGQLVTAELDRPGQGEHSRVRQQTRWTRDDAGRPVSVERTLLDLDTPGVSPELFEAQTWTWHESEPRVLARTWTRGTGDLAQLQWEALETLETQSSDYMRRAIWADAVSANDVDCTLPRGLGHGYPELEGLYELGVEAGERPGGIGFAYGYNGYGWFYGDDAWYGHGGVASDWAGAAHTMWLGRPMSGTVRYDDAGRMVEETLEVAPPEGTVEPAGRITRRRQVDARGHIIGDRVTLTDGTQRDLRFTWGERGLIERGLWLRSTEADDWQMAQSQTWSRNAAGQPLRHEVHFHETATELDPLVLAPCEDCTSGELTWRYDDAGQLVERSVEGNTTQRLTWDEAGRLTARTGAFHMTAGSGSYDERFEFDAQGRLVRECGGYDALTCTESVWDEADRLVLRRHIDAQGGTTVAAQYAFGCE